MPKTYNWGIIGPGKIARKFATAIQSLPNARFLAVASRDYNRAKEFSAQFDVERSYGSYQELVNDPDIDIIYIATPHSEHYDNAMLCLNNGKNVLCEKAFTSNAMQLEQLIVTARSKKLFLMEAIWTRFLPTIEKMLELIKSGVIGEIRMLHADFGFPAPYDKNSRIFNPQLAGGSLLDIGIYPLFLSLLVLGEPKEIKALAYIGETGVDESMGMNLLYENGAIAVLSSTVRVKTTTRADIFGTKGNIGIKPRWMSQSSLEINPIEGLSEEFHFQNRSNGIDYEIEEAMKCLDSGLKESPRLSLDFSLSLMKIMDEIRKQTGVYYEVDNQ